MRRARVASLALVIALGSYLTGGGAAVSQALLVDRETSASTFTTAASFPDSTPPVVLSSVASKTVPYLPGFIRQGGSYYVYANVTDAGSSVLTVTAGVSTVTTGMTAAPLVAGSYSIGGTSYNYRSGSIIADATLSAGARAYTVAAVDAVGNSVTQGGFSVTVDNTRPAGATVATANGGTIIGRPELADTVTLTFTEVVEPNSILGGWNGVAASVVVRITNAAGGDALTVRNAANTAQLPLGSINLGGTGYVGATRDFGSTGTASSMVQSGSTITITLGSPSGVGTTQSGTTTMTWTPSATATDRAGNVCQTTVITEAAPADVEF
ncbi:MAG: hypothetical protein M3Q38_00565 [Chloroflexota bacterium]|nr:hypothetical protein [Chloroflexota bacterium]